MPAKLASPNLSQIWYIDYYNGMGDFVLVTFPGGAIWRATCLLAKMPNCMPAKLASPNLSQIWYKDYYEGMRDFVLATFPGGAIWWATYLVGEMSNWMI